ncbi:hypothetical protein [Desulfoluna butyratoxydans]|uniref:hypothetical protein n=1 Tax=Desulfoluna butyratoxydans TaxID=231438 RepID=UPI0015D2CE60|nr:hypothetical protein [Desulfoluna butyratoxydans]
MPIFQAGFGNLVFFVDAPQHCLAFFVFHLHQNIFLRKAEREGDLFSKSVPPEIFRLKPGEFHMPIIMSPASPSHRVTAPQTKAEKSTPDPGGHALKQQARQE